MFYFKVTVYNLATGEVFEVCRYDSTPARAVSNVIKHIKKHFYDGPFLYPEHTIYCEVISE